jgi:hypothetical protein
MWPYLKGKAGSSAVTRVPAGGGFKHVGIVGMAVATRSILSSTGLFAHSVLTYPYTHAASSFLALHDTASSLTLSLRV